MIPKLETTKPYLFNLLCKKTKTKKQIKTIIIAVKKEKKLRKQCMPLPRFLQVILRLHSSWLNLWKLYFRFGLNSVEERQGSRWFCYDCFYFFRENFWEIGKVKISQLIVVSLSRIKIHHTNIFFSFFLFFFSCFFSFSLFAFSLLVESEIQESPQIYFDFPFEKNEMSVLAL